MDKDSLNNFKTLIEQRRQSLEAAPDSELFATNSLKKAGYLNESGQVATQFKSHLRSKLSTNPTYRVTPVKAASQIRKKSPLSQLPVVVPGKALQEPNVENSQNTTS
jgi:hypothetical protein